MDTSITTEQLGKRVREWQRDPDCQKRVAERIKFYDGACPGLYVNVTHRVWRFSFKLTDKGTGKQRTG